jgi:hypothetical protein
VRKVISECENDGEVNCSETASSNLSPISIKEYDVSYAKISVNPLNGNDSNKVKVLGATWNFLNDTLHYSVQELIEFARLLPMTKRFCVEVVCQNI